MTTGEETRQHIIRQAAAVFNRLGYAGATVSDIEEATGLKTGGIYRHFPGGKEALAVEAFEFCATRRYDRLVAAVLAGHNTVDRLHRLIASFTTPAPDAIPGGCAIMNAAIEHDHAGLPAIRVRVRREFDRWHALLENIIAEGRDRGELKPDIDPAATATVFIATIEGAVMLANLSGNRSALTAAAAHLTHYLDSQLKA